MTFIRHTDIIVSNGTHSDYHQAIFLQIEETLLKRIINKKSENMPNFTSIAANQMYVNETEVNERSKFVVSDIRIFYAIIGAFGFFGNAVSTLIFYKIRTNLSHTSYIFFVHISVIDTLFSLFLVLHMTTVGIKQASPTAPDSFWSDLYCKLWLNQEIFWFLNVCSVYSILSLALDRYQAIIKPIWYRHVNSIENPTLSAVGGIKLYKLYCSSIIAVSWVIAGVATFPGSVMHQVDEYGNCQHVPIKIFSKFFAFLLISVKLFLPLLLLIFVYSKIISRIKAYIHQPISNDPSNHSRSLKISHVRKQMVILYTTITLLYVICFTPNQIFFFAFLLGIPVKNFSPEHTVTVILLYLNSAIHPIIYLASLPSFRHTFTGLLGMSQTSVEPLSEGFGDTLND